MAEHLARGASGLRHLRWAREVLGTLRGLSAFEAHFTDVQRRALRAEVESVAALVSALSGAVKPYRDFLERSRTLARGRVRAAELACAMGDGFGVPQGEARRARIDAKDALAAVIEPERLRLHGELARAIDAVHSGLQATEERLAIAFSGAFARGVFPPLCEDGSRVLDEGDPDDDSAGR